MLDKDMRYIKDYTYKVNTNVILTKKDINIIKFILKKIYLLMK
jgi:hypothetical protein